MIIKSALTKIVELASNVGLATENVHILYEAIKNLLLPEKLTFAPTEYPST